MSALGTLAITLDVQDFFNDRTHLKATMLDCLSAHSTGDSGCLVEGLDSINGSFTSGWKFGDLGDETKEIWIKTEDTIIGKATTVFFPSER